MKTLFKILTAPIWIPLKALWMLSKILAFIFLLTVITAIVLFVLWQQGIILN
ncbi:MAG: hypothetical protein HY960_02920 [Ignavibacteriae bacterium]|nr:hypothetical protein [Ignavibacteriota bacterium]